MLKAFNVLESRLARWRLAQKGAAEEMVIHKVRDFASSSRKRYRRCEMPGARVADLGKQFQSTAGAV
jgi:hypothetical protein